MELSNILSGFRVVDLSKLMTPGAATGPVGSGKRRLEIREFAYPPGETMHQIDMESHIGTHLEAPRHFVNARYGRNGKDIAQLPLESLFGEAVFVDLSGFAPGQALGPEHMERLPVRRGDIVLIGNAGQDGAGRPHISKEAARWLAGLPIKMAGIDDSVFPEEPRYLSKDLTRYHTHDAFLSNDIPFIEGLANLGELSARRFLFFGFVAPIAGLDAFPIRAVALVPPAEG
jgi:arylformamidase